MQAWTERLLAVQELDLKIAKIAEQLRRIPDKLKEADAISAEENEALDKARAEQKDLEMQVRKLETEAEVQRSRKREFQTKTSLIKNNDEYRIAMTHVEGMDQVLRDLEDRQLELMLRIEELKPVVEEKTRMAGLARRRAEGVKDDLREFSRSCEDIALADLAERKRLASEVDPALLADYDRIRKGRNTSPTRPCVVPILDEACGRCRMRLTPQTCQDALNGRILHCPHCAALLYQE